MGYSDCPKFYTYYMHYLPWLNRDNKVLLLKKRKNKTDVLMHVQSNTRANDRVLIMPFTSCISE